MYWICIRFWTCPNKIWMIPNVSSAHFIAIFYPYFIFYIGFFEDISCLILIFNGAKVDPTIVSLLPKYVVNHYFYLKLKIPDCVPTIQVNRKSCLYIYTYTFFFKVFCNLIPVLFRWSISMMTSVEMIYLKMIKNPTRQASCIKIFWKTWNKQNI